MGKTDKNLEPVETTEVPKTEEAPKAEEVQKAAEAAVPVDPWQDKVTIKLFKDNQNYKDDVFVSVNGHNFQIKRGVEVEVPRCVQKVLENSERAKMVVEERLAKLSQTDDGYHKYADM